MSDVAFQDWLKNAHDAYEAFRKLWKFFDKYPVRLFGDNLMGRLVTMESQLGEFKPKDSELRIQKSTISALLKFEISKLHHDSVEATEYVNSAWKIVNKRPSHPDCAFLRSYIQREHKDRKTNRESVDAAESCLERLRRMRDMIDNQHEHRAKLAQLFLNQEDRQHVSCNVENIPDSIQESRKIYNDLIPEFWQNIIIDVLENDRGSLLGLQWLEDVIIFCNFLIDNKEFRIARRIISCMGQLMAECSSAVSNEQEDVDINVSRIDYAEADLCHCWGFYAMRLLRYSVEMREETGPESPEIDIPNLPDVFDNFGLLSETGVTDLELWLPCTYVTNAADALVISTYGVRVLDMAKKYFARSENSDDHIKIIQCLSKIHEYSNAFEVDDNAKCGGYNRSITLLEGELQRSYVKLRFLDLYLEMLFDVGYYYFQMASLKRKILRHLENPSSIVKAYVNTLAQKAIENLLAFLNWFKSGEERNFSTNFIGSVVKAYLHLAEAYLLPFVDLTARIRNLKVAEACYRDLLQHFEKYPEDKYLLGYKLPKVRNRFSKIQALIQEIS